MSEVKQIFDMGSAEARTFHGDSSSDAIKELYGKSAAMFAEIIRAKLPNTQKRTLLDIGSAKGELLADLLKLLPEYDFDTTVTDTNPQAVASNVVMGQKVVADAEALPFNKGSMDVVIMRYVMQFNSAEAQKKIVNEIIRVTKGIAIVQHVGPDNSEANIWRQKVSRIFEDEKLPQIKRKGMYWSSANEIESYMGSMGIKFERRSSVVIQGFSQSYIERYSMDAGQIQEIKQLLEDMDHITQTTWVVYP